MYMLSDCVRNLTSQNTTVSFKHERIPSMTGRALRSCCQHNLTILHTSSLNPNRFAPSGFSGRIPPPRDRTDDHKNIRLELDIGKLESDLKFRGEQL